MSPTTRSAPPKAATPVRVLLVEDNPGDARLIVEMLRELSGQFDLDRVDHLELALERLGRAKVDVVLLDLGLPDSQGLDTFERTHRGGGNEPIIVISGLDDEEVALAAVRSGAQDYLVKGRIEGAGLARVIRHAIERKRTEVQLRWLTLAVDQSPASIFITDPTGTIQYVNARFTAITGYAPAEAVGQTPRILKSGLTPPEYYHKLWQTVLAGDTWRAEIQNRKKSGEVYWDSVVVSPIRDSRGDIVHFLAVQEDITERKRAEQTLRERDERFQQLADNINEVFFIQDVKHLETVYISPAYEKIWGQTCQSLHDSPQSFIDPIPEEDRGPLLASIERNRRGEDGGDVEFRVVRPDGGVRWVLSHAVPIRNEAGEVYRIAGVALDITERKDLEKQYRQAQKMEAVGRLAGGVAHDFNNLLTAIFGYAELLAEDLGSNHPGRSDLNEIHSAATRAAGLTRQLLAFSRQQVLQPVVLSLNDVVANIQKMLQRLLGEDVALHASLASDIGNVRADPGQIEQVIMNLAVNARDAMPTGGKLTIETANVDVGEEYAESHPPVVPGRFVMLAVSDTGTGMDDATKAKVFEPFFTTKEAGKGTGLGLATVYGIVKQSGGFIWLYSEPGKGAAFKIYLPRVDAPSELPLAAPGVVGTVAGTETILLAEDDAVLRPLAEVLLTKLGYRLLVARDSGEALAIARGHKGEIHLLLSDVVMPGGGGFELGKRLVAERPQLRVLYMSGYTDEAVVRHGLLERGLNYLQKPFTPAVLVRRVRDVLDAK